MNKFVVRMLELGAELDKAVSPIEISMVINDAEILYKNHIEQLNIPVVVEQSEQLVICKKCGSSEMYQYTKTKDKCENCGNIQDY